MAAINVSVGGNTRQLERDIQKTVNKSYNINLKTKVGQPLGRITGQVDEFNKSLAASNARVIAFGASAGIIFGVQRALGAVASSAVEVQKSLQDINVILNVSVSQLNKFGSELFNIAKNTGQSFGEVAKAATEFSRQGLGVEETLKRTNQALILSRLSGLDAAKSVQTLTAAVNSYASQAVTASEVVNKFANVDAAFAVSSADLADALARVGSSAAQSGVSLNELIAIVTAAQQTTARGGAVIGNSFKTIFTRLQRGKVVDLLENLGINTKDGSGQIKSTIQLLQDLAKTYDQLGTLQQAEVAEKVGGVFQINILKAALADLGKEYSIYNSALGVAASTTDQAIRRNEELNQTYAAQINVLKENAKQLASSAGQRLVGPAFERVVGGANKVLGGINDNEGNDYGSVLGKGILDGLAQVIAGPGLALLGGIFAKLFADLSRFAVGSAKDFLGLNNAAKQQAELQRSITDILSRNPALIQQMGQGTAGVNKLAETLLATLRAQTIELQKQQQVGAQVASILAKSGVRVKEGVPIATTSGKPGKAAGYIPNFAGGVSKRDGFAETIAAYQAGYEPGPVSRVDNKVYNKAESVVKFPGAKDRGIVPPKDSPAGKQYQKDFKKTAGYDPYEYMETGMAKGFIPNFANERGSSKTKNRKEIQKRINQESKNYGYLIPSDSKGGNVIPSTTRFGYKFPAQPAYAPNIKQAAQSSNSLEDQIFNKVVSEAANYTSALNPPGMMVSEGKIQKNFNKIPGAKGALQGAIGSTFEVAIISALDYEAAQRKEGGDFDVRGNTSNIQKLFNAPAFRAADFKSSISEGNIVNFRDKVIKELGVGPEFSPEERMANAKDEARSQIKNKYPILFDKKGQRRTGLKSQEAIDAEKKYNQELEKVAGDIYKAKYTFASGYIPNFAALQDAIKRERAAGVPSGKIYVAQDKRLAANGYNPFGLGVFNTRDEPNSGARSKAIKSRGYSSGYVPNFVQEDRAPADLTASVGAIVTQLGFVAFALSGFGNQYKQSLSELTKTNVDAAKSNLRAARESGVASDSTRRQLSQNVRNAQQTTFGQKLGAGVSAGGAGLAIGAPIIAQTIANAIGKETKEARIGSAAASAFGDIGGFAGTGALVAGPKGAAVGALIGALTGLTGVIKQLSTNIPELSAQAKESASNLTQFNEASQRTKTAFEQLQSLRSQGQSVEAGKAEQELLKNIGKDFSKNPNLQAQAISAVINKDFAGLQQALDRNSESLLKLAAKNDNILAQQQFIENTRGLGNNIQSAVGYGTPSFGGANASTLNIPKFTTEEIKKFKEEFDKLFATSPLATPPFEKYGTKEGDEARKNLQDTLQTVRGLGVTTQGRGRRFDETNKEQRNIIIEKVFPDLPDDIKTAILNLNPQQFNQFVQNIVANLSSIENTYTSIDKNTGRFNEEVQKVLQNIGDVRSSFDSFAQSASFAVALQNDFNNALSAAKAALESAKLGNFGEIATQLGDTSAGRRYSTQAQMVGNQETRDNTINTAFSKIEQTLTDYLIQQAKKTQEGVRTTADTSGGEDPLKVAQKAQGEIRSSIETLIRQLTDVDFKAEDGDIDPLKSIESNLKTIFDKLKLPDEQKDELAQKLTPELQNLLREAVIANTLLKQQNALIAEQNVGQLMKEFITASQNALGGRERFASSNLTFLNPFQQAIGDLISLDKGAQGREVDIEKGRASLNLLDSISDIVGRNIIPSLGDDNPLRRVATEGLSMDIFDQLKSVFDEFQKLPKEKLGDLPTDLLKTLGQQVGLSGEDIDAQISSGSIDTLIDTIADRLAEIQVGGKVDDVALEGVRDSAIEQLLKEGSITPEMANNIKNGLAQSLSVETLMVGQLYEQTTLLSQILSKIPGGDTKKNEDDNSSKSSPKSSNFSLNTPLPTIAKGFVPSFAKEMNSIRKGVGGAKGSDYPLFVPNLNGEAAWINSGEKLIPNFANTGETAVLTRQMQKAMNMAEGFIPNFANVSIPKNIIEDILKTGLFEDVESATNYVKNTLKYPGSTVEMALESAIAEASQQKEFLAKADKIKSGSREERVVQYLKDRIAQGSKGAGGEEEYLRAKQKLEKFLNKTPDLKSTNLANTPKEVGREISKPVIKPSTEIQKAIASTFPQQNQLPIPDSVKKEQIEEMVRYANEQQAKINTPKTGQKSTSAAAKQVVKKGATKTILRALPGIGAILGLGEGAYRAFQGDYTGAALAAGAGLAGLKPGVGSGLSLALSAALIARDLQAAQDQISADQVLGTNKPLSETQLNTLLDAGKRLQTPSEFSLDDLDGTKKLLDQFIKNPNGLMRSNKPVYETIKSSVEEYLKNPAKTPSGELGKEIQKAFNPKDPESMQKWIEKLKLGAVGSTESLFMNETVWNRLARRFNNGEKLPDSVSMGVWNRLTGAIPQTGRVITAGYVNGSESPPVRVRESMNKDNMGFFSSKDNKYIGPSQRGAVNNMVRNLDYVKPDGTVLHYRRVRPGVRDWTDFYGPDFTGDRGKANPLRLISVTRPPNQEYVTEGTSNDIIGVKNGNTTEYFSTADAPLGGLGEYKGKKITDDKGGAIIEDSEGNKVGSIKSWQNDPAVKKAIETGDISAIENATKQARDTAAANRGEIYGSPSVIDVIAGTTPPANSTKEDKEKFEASQDFNNFLFNQSNKKYVDGVATDISTPESNEKPAPPPPPPPKQTTVEEIEEDTPTKAKGYIPSFTKEMSDIRKGVGGAIPTDTPLFVPNLNGEPAVINSGEKLIPNFAGTGETAVLTREMQKMMNFAQGYATNKYRDFLQRPEDVNPIRLPIGIGSAQAVPIGDMNTGAQAVPIGGKNKFTIIEELQKMKNIAQGYLPPKAQKYSGMNLIDSIKARHGKEDEDRFSQGFIPNFYKMGQKYSSRDKLFEANAGVDLMRGRKKFEINSGVDLMRKGEKSENKRPISKSKFKNSSNNSNNRKSSLKGSAANFFDDPSVMSQVDLSKFKNWDYKDLNNFFGPQFPFEYYKGPGLPQNQFPVYIPGPGFGSNFNFREWMFKSGTATSRIAQKSLPNYPVRSSNRYDSTSAKLQFGPWDDKNLPMDTRMNIWNNRKYSNQRTANLGYSGGSDQAPNKFSDWSQRAYDAAALAMAQSPLMGSDGTANLVGVPGPGRTMPSNLNYTMPDGRMLSYTRQNVRGQTRRPLLLSSVTRPQNEQYVTEGTSNDTIALQRNKNITEYYGSQGSTLGGLGRYSGRRIEESIPLSQGPINDKTENKKNNLFGGVSPVDFIRGKIAPDTFQNKFMSQISDTVGYQKFLQDDPLKLTPEPQQNFVRKTFIEDSSGKTVGTATDLSFDSEVRKAVATGNIYEIEKATRAARDRISSREERLAKMSPEDQDIFRQMYFKQDLADKAGGSAFVSPMYELTEQEYKQEQLYLQGRGKRPQIIAQKNQEAINMEDKYYKEMAEKSGMGDRFITDYIEPRERQIVREQQMKPIDESKRMLSRTDQFIKETDDYLMANQPSEQYLKDREQFIQRPKANVSIPTPPPVSSSPTPSSLPLFIEEEEDKKRYSRGFIPNFAVDPMAVTEAKMREKREAGPGSMPTFAMYNGKPMVYDARTQTPASAIRDHAFEGGYDGVVKRQFGAENTTKKNLVANMSMKPQEMMSQSNVNNSPVFNINFSPQTTYSSQKNNEIPNFANITKKYDSMIEDMRGSLKTVWDKYSSLENITSSNLRDGTLRTAPPRTKRLIEGINII